MRWENRVSDIGEETGVLESQKVSNLSALWFSRSERKKVRHTQKEGSRSGRQRQCRGEPFPSLAACMKHFSLKRLSPFPTWLHLAEIPDSY